MSSVADLVEPGHLAHYATASNLRLGEGIARKGGVQLLEFGPLVVKARVSDGERRTTELRSTPQGLAWQCTCSKRPDLFCKHCVAVAVVAWEEAPASRAKGL
ncbi:MAG TPA: hypothetical protein VGA77_02305 [Propylenella sp.]